MKLAAPFKLYNELNPAIDEFNLKFKDDSSEENMIYFLQQYQDKQINIEFESLIINRVFKFMSVHPRVTVRLKDHFPISLLNDNKIPWFYDSVLSASSMEMLVHMVEVDNVYEVYIADELLYDLPRVHEYCQSKGVRIRLIGNHIPSTDPDAGSDITSPIFSPRDFDYLSLFIDAIEFDCGTPYNWNRFNVYYKQWFQKKDWLGDLRYINLDLKLEMYPACIPARLTEKRMQCKRKCKDGSSHCRSCQLYYETSMLFHKKGLRFAT